MIGEFKSTLDAKGRMIVPSKFREQLGNEFVVTKGLDGCLFVYPDEEWTNIEEEKYLSRHDLNGRVVVIDCVTLWGTNFFFDNEGDTNRSLVELKEEFNKLTEQDAYLIFVTNEIGLGGVSPDAVQRRFTDLQGWLNQYIASRADEVVFMVSGIPMKVK